MQTVKLNSGEYLLVEIIKESKKFELPFNGLNGLIVSYDGRMRWVTDYAIAKGRYKIIGKGNELSENQKKEILDKDIKKDEPIYYFMPKDYFEEPEHARIISTTNFNKAFEALIHSLGMKPETTLILKHIKT